MWPWSARLTGEMEASVAPATKIAAPMATHASRNTNPSTMSVPTAARTRISKRCPNRSPRRPAWFAKINIPSAKMAGMSTVRSSGTCLCSTR
jgi:hypothetical protein